MIWSLIKSYLEHHLAEFGVRFATDVLLPKLKAYAAGTPNPLDDMLVAQVEKLLTDPTFLAYLKSP